MVLYSSFGAVYCMKWLKNIQIIWIIRIIFRYSNIRIMIFKLWILFVIRFGHFYQWILFDYSIRFKMIIRGNTGRVQYLENAPANTISASSFEGQWRLCGQASQFQREGNLFKFFQWKLEGTSMHLLRVFYSIAKHCLHAWVLVPHTDISISKAPLYAVSDGRECLFSRSPTHPRWGFQFYVLEEDER